MSRKPSQPVASNSLSHEAIAADIAAFRKRGGRIEVLGNTPFRTSAPTAFSSKTKPTRSRQPAAAIEPRKATG